MALRVKNIAEGFVDAHGVFHPIRAAVDYTAKRLSPSTAAAREKKKESSARKSLKRSVAKAAKYTGHTMAKKNPLPINRYIKAKVKRLANGDVKILISK